MVIHLNVDDMNFLRGGSQQDIDHGENAVQLSNRSAQNNSINVDLNYDRKAIEMGAGTPVNASNKKVKNL